jgi:hypothetical protein
MPKQSKQKGGKLPNMTVSSSFVKKQEWYQHKPTLLLILSVGIIFLIAFAIETKQNQKPANIQKVVEPKKQETESTELWTLKDSTTRLLTNSLMVFIGVLIALPIIFWINKEWKREF